MKIPKYLKIGELLSRTEINDLEDGTMLLYRHRTTGYGQQIHYYEDIVVKRKTVLQDVFGNRVLYIDNLYEKDYFGKLKTGTVYMILD